MFQKQMKMSDFFVFYNTNKNDELKMMSLSRKTKVLDCFFPQKCEVNACST